ncbi:uncharacterized protein LY89DRAFT_730152 [Mollisia scopiformis]|uniref:Uncharacterized protein n=1 Tax=Mollisia scopiformis TaxID=149040 RepID=A0A194XNR2_MOLSC|nr:uncharacterized protein LY89DRAFT_730152 [Mollisia scopiformis]KUJ21372.1 hypothetical protein LY89DRAFT_730152 [Mollisia scopiformis]
MAQYESQITAICARATGCTLEEIMRFCINQYTYLKDLNPTASNEATRCRAEMIACMRFAPQYFREICDHNDPHIVELLEELDAARLIVPLVGSTISQNNDTAVHHSSVSGETSSSLTCAPEEIDEKIRNQEAVISKMTKEARIRDRIDASQARRLAKDLDRKMKTLSIDHKKTNHSSIRKRKSAKIVSKIPRKSFRVDEQLLEDTSQKDGVSVSSEMKDGGPTSHPSIPQAVFSTMSRVGEDDDQYVRRRPTDLDVEMSG